MPSARSQAVKSGSFPSALFDQPLVDAMRQRACLLELVLADLLGARTILSRGLLPVQLLPGPAGPDDGRGLRAYAADVVKCPDGVWRVAADLAVGAANHPWARLLEAPALATFLPGLCRFLLGDTLRLASVPSRWLADPGALADVIESRQRWAIVDALGRGPAVRLDDMTVAQRIDWQDRVSEAPWRFAARLLVPGEPDRIAMARSEPGGWIAVERIPSLHIARH